MAKWWFTSDHHFDHPFVAGWRGFDYVTQMDNYLIDEWNKAVRGGDVVMHLGDFYWSNNVNVVSRIIQRLHGNIIWVKGNHDRWIKRLKLPYKHIHHRKIHDHYIVGCHYPMWTWNRKDYGAIHIHGHSHGKTLPRVNMLDVGVDSAKIILGEYRPFSLDEVLYLTNTTQSEERY